MKPSSVKCPRCGGDMVSRLNKNNQSRFWGCRQYPMCNGIRDVDGMTREEREEEKMATDYDEDLSDSLHPRFRRD